MFPKTVAALALGGLIAGCAHSPAGIDDDVDSDGAVQSIDENLARLEALDVIEVGALILDVPDEAYNCYGLCPEYEDDVAEAEEAAAIRLQALADAAEEAMDEPAHAYVCPEELIDENLAALRELEIVEVMGLLEAEPENNPMCYNLPCQEDIEAAEAINNERAWRLHNIAGAARGL